jgi:hypothetical protein
MLNKTNLYARIDNEGFYYYFAKYGPEKPEDVPEDIRSDWERATELSRELSIIEDRLMYDLEKAYDEDEDTFG